MEKKKDHKLPSSTSTSDAETNPLSLNPKIDEEQGKEDEKKPRIGSPSNENEPSQTHQNPPNSQWCNLLPSSNDQQPPQMVAATSNYTTTPTAVVASRLQPQMQLNPGLHQASQFQLAPHFMTPNVSACWVPQRPGYQIQGIQGQMGSLDNSSWQFSAGNGMGNPSRSIAPIPSGCYQFGYPYPPYSVGGPWDASSWWGQMPQSSIPCVYPFAAGACNYNPPPAPQPIANCSTALGQSSQKGVIQPSAKLSQKHQVLWEAQSAENVKLWAVITSLQSELADFKSRLVKLETEAKPPKPSAEQLAVHGKTAKRGRPRKVIASVDALTSPDEPQPRPRAKRLAPTKGPPEIKEINFQKFDRNKVENMEIVSSFIPPELANGEKTTSILTQNAVFPNIQQVERSKIVDNKSQGQFGELVGKGLSTAYKGNMHNGNHGWPSNVPSDNHGRDMMMGAANSQGFYSHGNVCVNEDENASEELDEGTAESEKEDDEERENVASACDEGMPQVKNEVVYSANTSQDGSNSRGFLSW